jgi:hypothetical protein
LIQIDAILRMGRGSKSPVVETLTRLVHMAPTRDATGCIVFHVGDLLIVASDRRLNSPSFATGTSYQK